jgi:hypothetical protein
MFAQNTKTTQQQSDVIRTSSTCKRKKEHKTAEEMQNTSKKSDENDGNRKHESNLHLVNHFVWKGCANSFTLFIADALEFVIIVVTFIVD